MLTRRFILIFSVCAIALGSIAIALSAETRSVVAAPSALPDIVFVARAHLATQDDVFTDELGPAGQFGTGLPKFAPGSKLMIRHSDGSLTTLIDGGTPISATGYLIDVLKAVMSGNNPWDSWQNRLPTSYFEKRWGAAWADADKEFWANFKASLKARRSGPTD